MLESLMQFSTENRDASFQNSKIIKGSWSVVLLDALTKSGYNVSKIRLEVNKRVLKGCKHSEILFYNNKRIMTLKSGFGVSANDVIKQFKIKLK